MGVGAEERLRKRERMVKQERESMNLKELKGEEKGIREEAHIRLQICNVGAGEKQPDFGLCLRQISIVSLHHEANRVGLGNTD